MPARNHKGDSSESGLEEKPRFESSSFSSTATDKAKEVGSTMSDKAEQAAGTVGAGMKSVGNAIREHQPSSGMLHNAGDAIADKLEGTGRYLQEHGLKGISEDATNMIRRNPISALLVGVGLGFLVAQILRR